MVPVVLLYVFPEAVLTPEVVLLVDAGEVDCLMPEEVETLLTDVMPSLPLLLVDVIVPDERLAPVELEAVRLMPLVADIPLLRLMLLDATPIPSDLLYPLVAPLSPQWKSCLSGPPHP